VEIYPAIDLMDGCAVRLVHGEKASRTIYEREPARMAARFAALGARLMHVVDLDGAFAGSPRNREALAAIAREGVPFEVGGGLRTLEAIEDVFALGATRAVIGTIIFREPELVRGWVERFGDRLVASLDAKHGLVQLEGWTQATKLRLEDAARLLQDLGFRHVEFTAIERDGTLSKPDRDATLRLADALSAPVVASGGVGTLEDIAHLAAAGNTRIEAAIVGKALYEGRFALDAALEVARADQLGC
jgi:phosphoribosylformimino-5-aminoimidazole carboxamide ribotide isomerase